MAGKEVKSAVKEFIGKNDEIVYNFKGDRKVIMKISPDGNELEIKKTNF